jgi:transcriptional regulator with XRE-family HTH domain
MIWEKEFLKLVKAEFNKKKVRNPRFSIRQYAKKLGLSIGALSELMAGKRRLTQARAMKILDALEITQEERSRLYMLMGEHHKAAEEAPVTFEAVTELQDFIKDWRNFILLSTMFQQDEEALMPQLQQATGLGPEEIRARLKKARETLPSESHFLNFQIDPFQRNSQIFTGSSLHAFQKSQIEFLKKATDTAQESPQFFNLALFTSVEKYERLMQEIRQVLLKYLIVEPEPSPEKLFQVSVQMIPLSERAKSGPPLEV